MTKHKPAIDQTLNPDNAASRGYFWWKDVIYDEEAPEEVMRDVVSLAQQGFIFGACAAPDGEQQQFIGVYKKSS